MSRFDMQSYHSPLMSGTVTLEERGLLPDPVKYPLQKNHPMSHKCLSLLLSMRPLSVFLRPPPSLCCTQKGTLPARGEMGDKIKRK